MAVLASDILIKTMIEAAFADLRRNQWILEDVFAGLLTDPLSKDEYGAKEMQTAVEWFLSTDIPVLLQHRVADAPTLPCVTISYAPGQEDLSRTSIGDQRVTREMEPDVFIQPNNLTRDFAAKSYDPITGLFVIPDQVDTTVVREGQFIFSKKTGKAYVIQKVIDSRTVQIATKITDDFRSVYVRTKFSLWNVESEMTFFRESYTLGCHSQGSAASAYWLWQVTTYCLLRYKEAYLEARGFDLSSLSFGPLQAAEPEVPGDRTWVRQINLSGVVPCTWVKYAAPKLEVVRAKILIADGPSTPPGVYGDYIVPGNPGQIKPNAPSWEMAGDYEESGNGMLNLDQYEVEEIGGADISQADEELEDDPYNLMSDGDGDEK